MDPLLQVLRHSIPGEQQHRVEETEPWQEYLEHLRTMEGSSVGSEKQYLESSHRTIQLNLQALTQTSYKQFVESSDAIQQFTQQFGDFQKQAQEFSENQLFDREFEQHRRGSSQNDHHDMAEEAREVKTDPVVLLKNVDKVQDILELPSLAMACVRNGYYAEALDLASHTRRLKLRYNNVKVIAQVEQETEKVMRTMTCQLVKLLRQDSRPSSLVKAVSYLRRMSPFNPTVSTSRQLQQLYLLSRYHYIQDKYSRLKGLVSSPDKYLKEYLTVFREHVYNTLTNFNAIFADEGDGGHDQEVQFKQRIKSEFLRKNVDDLQASLELMSEVTDPGARKAVWLQIVFCTQSMGRIGADFWPLLHSITPQGMTDEEYTDTLEQQKQIAMRLGDI